MSKRFWSIITRRIIALGLLLGGPLLSHFAFADVKLLNSVKGNVYIQINGEIKAGDYNDFINAARKAYDRKLGGTLNVVISSPGGNVREAILIGTAVRKLRLGISTPITHIRAAGSECYSACLFIWVGSVDPVVPGGVIGIHRPRFDRTYFSGLTSSEAAQKYRKLTAVTKTYLRNMGVRTDLIELMYQIPSSELHVLDRAEVKKYALSDSIPSYDEWLTSKCGKMTDAEVVDWWKTQLPGRGSQLSDGYKKYLIKKDKRVTACQWKAEWRDRKLAASQFFASH